MPISFVLFAVIGLGVIAWAISRAKAAHFAPTRGKLRLALPQHYGFYVGIWTVVPALIALWIWSGIAPALVDQAVLAHPLAQQLPLFDLQRQSILGEAYSIASNPSAFATDPLARDLAPVIAEAKSRYGIIGAIIAATAWRSFR